MIQFLPLFGSPLVTALARSSFTTSSGLSIPGVLAKCFQEIEQKGLDIEGIFRKSGSTAIINQLQSEFEDDQNPFLISIPPTVTVHSLTGLFKRYLQLLPEPVIPRQHQPLFLEVFDQEHYSKETLKRRLKEACKKLPYEHLHLLQFLIDVAYKIQLHQEKNQMSVESLAIIFAPTCIRLDGLSQLMPDKSIDNNFCPSYNSLPLLMDKGHLFQKARELLLSSLKKRPSKEPKNRKLVFSTTSIPNTINPKKKKRYSSSSSIFSLKYKPNDLLQLDLVKESSTWIRIFEFMMTYPEVFATLTNPTQSQKYSKKSPTKERRNINLKIDTQFRKNSTYKTLSPRLKSDTHWASPFSQQERKLLIDVNLLEFKESRELIQTFESLEFTPKVDRLPTPRIIRKAENEGKVTPMHTALDTHSKYIRTLQNWKLREEENPSIIIPQEVQLPKKKRSTRSNHQVAQSPLTSDWIKLVQSGLFFR
ncbi:Rho GTPase activation protein [Choanephora cucurbitarum]|nr:Rho GTPase activation protein [Choanephora cucurbitarum]